MGRLRSDQPGAVPITRHKANLSNIEQAENDEKRARGFQPFPAMVHGEGGLWKQVNNQDELEAAVAKGWYADLREVPVAQPDAPPDAVSQMTLAQAKAKIASATIFELGAIEADEQSHGNRAEVMAMIDAAKDAAMSSRKNKRK